MARGLIFNIQYFNIHDGPGIRTVVFFKGCPLNCQWCSNPEAIQSRPELGVRRGLCNQCGKCLEACQEKALSFDEEEVLRVAREKCRARGACVAECHPEALTVYGRETTAEEVFEEVRRDQLFYEGSGGGVTASGGEPLQQPAFLAALFRLCRDGGIHTCLETSGYSTPRVWKQVLPLTDYVLFDLKHMDSRRHRELTGRPNQPILAGARLVAGSGVPVLFRMPLVPGSNDGPENIEATADFVKSLDGDTVQGLELMPYHRLGVGKYETLDRRYALEEKQAPGPDDVEAVRRRFEAFGLTCTVSR
jgi:pyruvate formate lyase activating enzyme